MTADGRWSDRVMVAALTILCASACWREDRHPEPSYYLFQDVPGLLLDVPAESRSAPRPWQTGAPIPLEEAASISTARVWRDSLVGIVDPMACQVLLYALGPEQTLSSPVRFGRCGEGPGEFRGVTDVYLDGDSVIVVDEQLNAITLFPVGGGAPRTIRLTPTADYPWRPLEVLRTQDGALLVAGARSAGGPPDAAIIRWLDRRDGSIRADFLADSPAAGRNRASIVKRLFACSDPHSDRLVVANRWRAERAILGSNGDVLHGPFVSHIDWIREEALPDRPGERPAAFVRPVCGTRGAMIQWRTLHQGGGIDRYYLEILDPEGQLILQEHGRSPPIGHPAAMGIAGTVGDAWVGFSNDSRHGPALRFLRPPAGTEALSGPIPFVDGREDRH